MSAAAFSVLHEDNHLLIVTKRPGVLVQGDATGDTPLLDLLKSYIKGKYNKPGEVFLGTVHRLDRPVSGLVVFARTSKALARMNTLFASREVEKVYWALVNKRPSPPTGNLVHWLVKDEARNVTTAYSRETAGGQKAELSYSLLAETAGQFLVEVRPRTGRPHQIRVQLAQLDCPIVGDLKYGAPRPNPDASICLHARSLTFVHPVQKERLTLTASLPPGESWQGWQTFGQ